MAKIPKFRVKCSSKCTAVTAGGPLPGRLLADPSLGVGVSQCAPLQLVFGTGSRADVPEVVFKVCILKELLEFDERKNGEHKNIAAFYCSLISTQALSGLLSSQSKT